MEHRKTDRRTAAKAILAACALALLPLLLFTTSAIAATISNQRPLLFSFDGTGTTAGRFGNFNAEALAPAIDNASGDLYVADTAHSAVDKFNYLGAAQNFPAGPAAGASSLYGTGTETFTSQNATFFTFYTGLAVDNSGGSGGSGEGEQGRLYVSGSKGPIDAFKPNGEFLWTLPAEEGGVEVTKGACGIAVDPAGHLWVGLGSREKVVEFDTTGAGPPSNTPIDEFPVTDGNKEPCQLAVDHSGKDVYLAHNWPNAGGSGGTAKYHEGTYESTLTPNLTRAVAIDQSSATGHIFTLSASGSALFFPFSEYDSTGAPVPGSPFGVGGELIGDGARGIAYNPAKDWVYTSERNNSLAEWANVKAFGPRASGTAPDVTSEATTAIGEAEATFHGKIEPHGVPNSYHFEWIKAEAQQVKVEASGGKFSLSYDLDGAFGPLPAQTTGAKGKCKLTNGSTEVKSCKPESGGFAAGEAITAFEGYIPPEAEITAVALEKEEAGVKYYKLTISKAATSTRFNWEVTGDDLAYNAAPEEVKAALEGLPAIGAGNVSVTGAPGSYTVLFEGALAGRDLEPLGNDTAALSGTPHSVTVTRITKGRGWAGAKRGPGAEWPEGYPGVNPADAEDHVSYALSGLAPNTAYDVRLVGTATEAEGSSAKRLDSYAPRADTFMTPPASYLLTVHKSGSGAGTVTSSPAGILCGSECSAKFEEGKGVTLTASAAEGSTFAGWSGSGCSGTGTCEVTMSEAKSLSAEFTAAAPTLHTLTIAVTGNGSVSADSGTISGCTSAGGPSCEGTYVAGTKVLLTETPGEHSRFGGWATPQCDESTAATCEVEVSADEAVSASFLNTQPLSVTIEGSGSVTSEPAGISCSPFCNAEFDEGTLVILTASAAPEYAFVSWKGCELVEGRKCHVTMNAARAVKARFAKVQPLTAQKEGTGQGTVSSAPAGISCGPACTEASARFAEGATVLLKAVPLASTSTFNSGTGWTGCDSVNGEGKCVVAATAAKSVEAKFEAIPSNTLSFEKEGGGTGTVSSSPAGIACGATCTSAQASFLETKTVLLKAVAATGSSFTPATGWTGCDSVNGEGKCVVAMSSAHSVKAEFK